MDQLSDEDAYLTTRTLLISVLLTIGGTVKLSPAQFDDSSNYDLIVVPSPKDFEVLEIRVMKKPHNLN